MDVAFGCWSLNYGGVPLEDYDIRENWSVPEKILHLHFRGVRLFVIPNVFVRLPTD